jgi:signal recognition particle receptor subunit alpha
MEEQVGESSSEPKVEGAWTQLVNRLTGNKKVTQSDLEPLLKVIKEDLVKKNVAVEVAEKICDTVAQSVVGTQVGTFETFKAILYKSLEPSIRRILTPSTSIDILREIASAKQSRRPYVITFIGVNGVGNTTFDRLYFD